MGSGESKRCQEIFSGHRLMISRILSEKSLTVAHTPCKLLQKGEIAILAWPRITHLPSSICLAHLPCSSAICPAMFVLLPEMSYMLLLV